MRLQFHILNVQHGSSVVVHLTNDGEEHFGVIDSNMPSAAGDPAALRKLRALGAHQLSFICLTHPHKDHFKGLSLVANAYDGRIDDFFSCPFGDLLNNRGRLRALSQKLARLKQEAEGEPVADALELLRIIKWAEQSAGAGHLRWTECAGEEYGLAPTGFAGVDVATMLPPAKAKGRYMQQIDGNGLLFDASFDENSISLALKFSLGGTNVVIGGDGTVTNWSDRRRWEEKKGQPIDATAVNLPHHGSKKDCSPDVLEQLFAKTGERYGISSANGKSHPEIEVIKWMSDHGVKPYCTNLIRECGANAQKLLTLPTLAPEMQTWVRDVASTSVVQPCQGDVVITVEATGATHVAPELPNACLYRGDFAAFGL